MIDLTYLNEMSAGSPELIKEMISIFKEQVPEFTDGMKKALSEKDWSELGAIAHKAKSSVLIMGMNKTGELLKKFEILAHSGQQTETYEGMIEQFLADCAEAIKELDKIAGSTQK
jgi:HPt (histidine-containing phosphotransfer) domain-containing protein